MRKTFICAALLSMFVASGYATSVGYSNGTIDKLNCFRVGNTTTQGQAIRLSKAKLQALKGKTIDFAEFAVGSANATDKKLNVFITTSLDGPHIADGTLEISRALKNLEWKLDQPYTITGEEENLYIGYTAEIPTSYKMLLADGSYDISGYNFALEDGKWVDTFGMGKGSACISINVEGAVDYTDVIVSKGNFSGYFKAKNKYDWTARLVNAGTTAVTSFDAKIKLGDNVSTQHIGGLNIAPKGKYSFKLDGLDADTEGERNISVEICNVNGGNDEYDTSDNNIEASVFFYPQDMERTLLVEGFTGQDCTGCPSGHKVIAQAISLYGESVAEISHHAGYYPDMFTMQEDRDCLFFYNNPTNTYAPAVTINRYADEAVSSYPVIQPDLANTCKIMDDVSKKEPYVSLNLETELDENTRELKVKLGVKPHKNLPSDKILYNLYLVQDNIKAYQASGGSAYNHERVSRGCLTGNSWGVILNDLTPGNVTTTKEITFTIPEKIHSSFWTDDMISDGMYTYKDIGRYNVDQVDIEAVLKDMSVVAYVGEYDTSDNSKNFVYNCCEAKLGESHKQAGFDGASTGIETVEDKAKNNIYLDNGKIGVDGKYDKVLVYNISGKQMNSDAALEKGVYVVKVISNGKQTTKKVLVK